MKKSWITGLLLILIGIVTVVVVAQSVHTVVEPIDKNVIVPGLAPYTRDWEQYAYTSWDQSTALPGATHIGRPIYRGSAGWLVVDDVNPNHVAQAAVQFFNTVGGTSYFYIKKVGSHIIVHNNLIDDFTNYDPDVNGRFLYWDTSAPSKYKTTPPSDTLLWGPTIYITGAKANYGTYTEADLIAQPVTRAAESTTTTQVGYIRGHMSHQSAILGSVTIPSSLPSTVTTETLKPSSFPVSAFVKITDRSNSALWVFGRIVSSASYGLTLTAYHTKGTGGTVLTSPNAEMWVGPYVTPEMFGAVVNGTADDSTAINDAANAARLCKAPLYFGTGKHITQSVRLYATGSTSIVLDCDVRSDPEAEIRTDADPAVIIDSTVDPRTIYLPRIVRTTRAWTDSGPSPQPNWNAGAHDVGLHIKKMAGSQLYIPYVYKFTIGVHMNPSGVNGISYNTINFGYILDNAIGILIEPSVANSWVNENNFVGGDITYSTDAGVYTNGSIAGCSHVEFRNTANTSTINNNKFFGTSFEGHKGEYTVLFDKALGNSFYGIRLEHPSTANVHPKIHFSDDSVGNVFMYPLVASASLIVSTDVTAGQSSAQNVVLTRNGTYQWGGGIGPTDYMQFWHNTSNDNMLLSVLNGQGFYMRFVPGNVSIANNTITITNHGLAVNDPVELENDGRASGVSTALPPELTDGTTYWVQSVVGNDITLSATRGGAAIDLSTQGTGVHFIRRDATAYQFGVSPGKTRWKAKTDTTARIEIDNAAGRLYFGPGGTTDPVTYLDGTATAVQVQGGALSLLGGALLTGVQTLTVDSTTPSVSSGNVFVADQTVATSITNFTNGVNGQILFIVAADGLTTLVDGSTIILSGSVNYTPTFNDSIGFVRIAGAWTELFRSGDN